jgi:Universal stress protein family
MRTRDWPPRRTPKVWPRDFAGPAWLPKGQGISGQSGAAIVAAAVDADLIVMSTHGRGGPLRSILGSVANEVVRKSRRPVLLVCRARLSREGDVGQEAGRRGAISPEGVSPAVEESGYYELLPDTFAEREAGLVPRHAG